MVMCTAGDEPQATEIGRGGRGAESEVVDVAHPLQAMLAQATAMSVVCPRLAFVCAAVEKPIMRMTACVFIGVLTCVACGHDTPTVVGEPLARGPAPTLVGAPVVALGAIDAPGFAIEALTIELRDGIIWGSGVEVVDALALRSELAACVELPCPEVMQERYRSAEVTASATLARVGTSVLGGLRMSAGTTELVRENAEGADPKDVVLRLGRLGGAALRRALEARAESSRPSPSPSR
jgi:hypothetical protein